MDSQRLFETAMGMQGYRGSPAELEDREKGIKVGGYVHWLVDAEPVAKITKIDIDGAGDPCFHLQFVDDRPILANDRLSWRDGHKNVIAQRDEIKTWDENWIDLKTENIIGGLRNYGYRILTKPAPGHYQAHYENLRSGLQQVESTLDSFYKRRRCGPPSKEKLIRLHIRLPEPCWGVEVAE